MSSADTFTGIAVAVAIKASAPRATFQIYFVPLVREISHKLSENFKMMKTRLRSWQYQGLGAAIASGVDREPSLV